MVNTFALQNSYSIQKKYSFPFLQSTNPRLSSISSIPSLKQNAARDTKTCIGHKVLIHGKVILVVASYKSELRNCRFFSVQNFWISESMKLPPHMIFFTVFAIALSIWSGRIPIYLWVVTADECCSKTRTNSMSWPFSLYISDAYIFLKLWLE